MTYTFDEAIVSDLHKDAFGFRPREDFWLEWAHSSDLEKQATWDWLLDVLKVETENERLREQRAIQQFEQLVSKSMVAGAGDRETALRWIMEASDCDGDWEYLCFHHGLPYKYFSKEVQNG